MLFITATVAGVLSAPLLGVLGAPDYLAKASDGAGRITMGSFLIVVMAFACAGIAIWLYPVLRERNEALALGSVGFRLLEAAIFIVTAAIQLSLLVLSQKYAGAGARDAASIEALGAVAKSTSLWLFSGAGAMAFALGALMYYWVFYQSRLIPRWLAVWGLAAILLHLTAALFTLFGVELVSIAEVVLHIPIFLQEMALAGWLITKGFDAPAAGPIAGERDAGSGLRSLTEN